MSRLISDILQAPEPQFSHQLQEWERLSSYSGIDVRLAIEIVQSLGNLLVALGLDPKDTTGRELYQALIHRASEDSKKLAELLDISVKDSPEIMAKKIIEFANKLPIARSLWTVKPSVIKRFLHDLPPKKLMKICGFRSIDSVLKRQNPGEILALSYLVEPPEWSTKLHNQYIKLQLADFDKNKAEIILISPIRAELLRKSGYSLRELVLPARELGVTLVIAPKKRFEGDVMLFVNMIIESLRDQCLYAAYFSYSSTQPKFGEIIGRTLEDGMHTSSQDTFGTSWSTLHGLVSRSDTSFFRDYGGPALEFDDHSIPATHEVLGEVHSDLAFWKHTFTGMNTLGGPVSCNLSDVVVNMSNGSDYDKRFTRYLQSNLWDEFRIRYLSLEPVARSVINNDMMIKA